MPKANKQDGNNTEKAPQNEWSPVLSEDLEPFADKLDLIITSLEKGTGDQEWAKRRLSKLKADIDTYLVSRGYID